MFYIYGWYVNNKPILIGKGKNNRYEDWYNRANNIKEYIKEIGKKNINVKIIKSGLSEKAAFTLEKEIISEIGLKNLLNNSKGGEGPSGFKRDKKTKKLMSENNFWRGKYRSGELNPMYGKKHSAEAIEKMKQKALLRFSKPENNPMYGKKHSDISKDKIRQFAIEQNQKRDVLGRFI